MMNKIRSFLAIPLPAELQQRLFYLQHKLKQGLPELRLSPPGNLHLSLQFLGDQPQALLDQIGHLMQSTGASISPFSVELKGLGAFPGGRHPRVIWLGVEPVAPLLALQATLADGLDALGLPGETRPYQPHLTLGRLRRPTAKTAVLERLRESSCGYLEVNSLVLFASRLTPQGAVHQPLTEVELTGSG
jgi:2'-5' RNA ligase